MVFKQKIIFRFNINCFNFFLIKVYKTCRLFFLFDAFESFARLSNVFGRDQEMEFQSEIKTLKLSYRPLIKTIFITLSLPPSPSQKLILFKALESFRNLNTFSVRKYSIRVVFLFQI
jgi:hypothetical protein